MTDTRTRQVKDHRIRFLAEINPPLAVKRQRGARAARDNARSMSCVQHPSSIHGHMENWRVQENIHTIMSNVKQMKCVSPSSRTLATCASTASASTPYRFSSDVSLDKAVALSNCSKDMAMYKPPVEIHREFVSPTENTKQREHCATGHDPTRKHLVFLKKTSTMALTLAHAKVCCGIAAKELAAPMSRSEAT